MAENALTFNENTTLSELYGHRNRKWVTKKQLPVLEQRVLFCVFTCVQFNYCAKLSLGWKHRAFFLKKIQDAENRRPPAAASDVLSSMAGEKNQLAIK